MSDPERAHSRTATATSGPSRSARARNLVSLLRVLATVAVFGVLAWGGLSKLNDSGTARRFIAELLVVDSALLVALIGASELLLALWVASGWRSAQAFLLAAAAFTAFTATHAWGGSVVGESVSCGCLQGSAAIESMSRAQWIALTAGLAAISGLAAASCGGRATLKGVPG